MRNKHTDSGIWKENAQRLNFSCLTEAVMPEVKVEAWCIVKNGTSHHLTNPTSPGPPHVDIASLHSIAATEAKQ